MALAPPQRQQPRGLGVAGTADIKAVLKSRRLSVPGLASGSGIVGDAITSSPTARFVDRGGLVLTNVNLYLIFWGSNWAADASPSAAEITDAAQRIFDGPYLSGLLQYRGIEGGTVKATIQVTDSDPPNPFFKADVVRLVHQRLGNGLPEPDDDPWALYCVIMPPGVSSAEPRVVGEHSYFVYFDLSDLSLPPDVDIARAHYAWVSNDGTLDSITTVLSHELVEACTDPNGDGIQGADGTCAQPGWCEIGDVCGATDVRNGVTLQAYWSQRDQACIVPGGTDDVTNPGGATTTADTPTPAVASDSGGSRNGRGNTAAPVAPTQPTKVAPPARRADPAALISPISQPRRSLPLSGASFTGGLMASMWLAPIVAAILAIGTYVTPTLLPPWARLLSDSPALAGPVIAVIVWIVLGALYSPATSARNANGASYADLQERLTELTTWLGSLGENSGQTSAFQEAASHVSAIATELGSAGPRWVTAAGYIAAWKRVHRAEEALFEVQPRTKVLSEAMYDEWRLNNSNIQHESELTTSLEAARAYLQALPWDGSEVPASSVAPATPNTKDAASAIASEAQARAMIRMVRFSINDFRDQRWAALVRARNLLYGTMIMTELFAFAVLALAVIDHSPTTAIVAGVVFFLVGALVGLFNRLNQQASAGTMVEDYSLAWVRLLLTPILSGLAAIGGVVLTGMLTLSGLTGLVQPGNGNGAASTVTLPVLADIFDLNKFRIGFLLALVFGGTPILISNRLQQLTDQYKNDLKSTEATSGATVPASSSH